MKFIRLLVFSIVSIVLFLLSIGFVVAGIMAADHQLTSRIIHVITQVENPLVLVVVGLILFVGSLIFYNRAGQSHERSGIYSFEGQKGMIDISLGALEDCIVKHFASKSIVHSVRARVGTSRDRKKLRVRASVSVWSEQNLKDAGEAVQDEIVRSLKEGLGLDNVETVLVSVDKIVASKSPNSASLNSSSRKLP